MTELNSSVWRNGSDVHMHRCRSVVSVEGSLASHRLPPALCSVLIFIAHHRATIVRTVLDTYTHLCNAQQYLVCKAGVLFTFTNCRNRSRIENIVYFLFGLKMLTRHFVHIFFYCDFPYRLHSHTGRTEGLAIWFLSDAKKIFTEEKADLL